MSLWYLQFDNVHKKQIIVLVWIWWSMLLASRFGYCSTVMFNSPLKLNLVLKILRWQLIFWSWCWYEDACSPQDLVNARAQSSDFRKSPPLQHFTPLPCGQFCKCQISKLIAGKREREEHLTWCHLRLMSWQNPVLSETLLLTHRLNRFRDLLFIFWQIAWTTIFQDRFRKLSKLGKYRVLPEG